MENSDVSFNDKEGSNNQIIGKLNVVEKWMVFLFKCMEIQAF